MSTLYFSDILKKVNLDVKDVLLIRHPLSNFEFKKCMDSGFLIEYTRVQRRDFAKKFRYWAVFVGDHGSNALYKGIFRVDGYSVNSLDKCPSGYPYPEMFQSDHAYYDIEELNVMQDMKDRLLIDWGKSARMWHQQAANDKEVIAIQRYPKEVFPGYENIVVSFFDLKEIVEDRITYSDWYTALSSIYAVYLITDVSNGKQYIGSAYGKDGLWGRWKTYVETGHGNTIEMMDIMRCSPMQYKNFQFSVLQILPKNLSNDEVISIESQYKDKLLTRQYGMNSN